MPRDDDAPNPDVPATSAGQPVRHLRQIDLSRRWHVSPRTLERWRCFGGGPPFLKINGRILYRLEDIEAFEAAQLRTPAGRGKGDANADTDNRQA
jgi:hypothetical protein